MIVNKTLQDAQTATGNGAEVDVGTCANLTIYVTSAGTTSGGTIQVETSDVPGYAGTWSPVGAALNASASSPDKKIHTVLTGPLKIVRARIATTITGGGTITVRIIGN